jgi:hypothetical protein
MTYFTKSGRKSFSDVIALDLGEPQLGNRMNGIKPALSHVNPVNPVYSGLMFFGVPAFLRRSMKRSLPKMPP